MGVSETLINGQAIHPSQIYPQQVLLSLLPAFAVIHYLFLGSKRAVAVLWMLRPLLRFFVQYLSQPRSYASLSIRSKTSSAPTLVSQFGAVLPCGCSLVLHSTQLLPRCSCLRLSHCFCYFWICTERFTVRPCNRTQFSTPHSDTRQAGHLNTVHMYPCIFTIANAQEHFYRNESGNFTSLHTSLSIRPITAREHSRVSACPALLLEETR